MSTDSSNDVRVDILILGAGLAGLRAAIAAKSIERNLKVLVVTPKDKPSGSSFANRNQALGMQVLLTAEECGQFVSRVHGVAPPGNVNPKLTQTLAVESAARFEDILRLGIAPQSTLNKLTRVPGCFFPELPSAAIFSDLPALFQAMLESLHALGGGFISGWEAVDLLTDADFSEPNVRGALLRNKEGELARIRAKSVILATGGPASLFFRDVSGPASSGYSYGLLDAAGAQCDNLPFLQFMWYKVQKNEFFQPAQLALKNARIRLMNGSEIALPHAYQDMAEMRHTHCPASYSLHDTDLDLFLARQLDADGSVAVTLDGTNWTRIAPMAHAGNGGAVIDEHGLTSVNGLYACGECITGMHGANRIGGAMMLATQVFGARAGHGAAVHALKADSSENLRETMPPESGKNANGHPKPLGWLERRMQQLALFAGALAKDNELQTFASEISEQIPLLADLGERMRHKSALVIINQILQNRAQAESPSTIQ